MTMLFSFGSPPVQSNVAREQPAFQVVWAAWPFARLQRDTQLLRARCSTLAGMLSALAMEKPDGAFERDWHERCRRRLLQHLEAWSATKGVPELLADVKAALAACSETEQGA